MYDGIPGIPVYGIPGIPACIPGIPGIHRTYIVVPAENGRRTKNLSPRADSKTLSARSE